MKRILILSTLLFPVNLLAQGFVPGKNPIIMTAIVAPAISTSGQARLYMDISTNHVMLSENGSAYAALGSGGSGSGGTGTVGPGTLNTVAKFTATDVVEDSSITDNGTTVAVGTGFSITVATGVTVVGTGAAGFLTLNTGAGSNLFISEDGFSKNSGSTETLSIGNIGAGIINMDLDGDFSAGTLHSTGLTSGSVLFAGASGLLSQDNSNLFFDNSNNRLGILTNSPANTLVIASDGSASVPVISMGGTTDTNTGFYHPSADQIAISIAGSQNTTWFNSSPGSGYGGNQMLLSNQPLDQTWMNNGGIGSLTVIRDDPIIDMFMAFGVGNNPGSLTLGYARGTIASPTPILLGDVLGQINFAGNLYSIKGGWRRTANIRAVAAENFSGAPNGGGTDIKFTSTDIGNPFVDSDKMTIESTGPVRIQHDGTAALPVLTLGTTSDPNTGFFHPAADTIALSVGGSEIIRAVTNTAGLNTAFGGGITNPTDGIEINSSQFNGLRLSTFSGGGVNDSPPITLMRGRGSRSSPAVVTTGDVLGNIMFVGSNGTIAGGYPDYVRGATITTYAMETFSTTTSASDIAFNTTPTGTTSTTERMRVKSTGEIVMGNGSVGSLTINSAGGTNASITESGLNRVSGSDEVFNFTNTGAGNMAIQQDGVNVLTQSYTQFTENTSALAACDAAHNGILSFRYKAGTGSGMCLCARDATTTYVYKASNTSGTFTDGDC